MIRKIFIIKVFIFTSLLIVSCQKDLMEEYDSSAKTTTNMSNKGAAFVCETDLYMSTINKLQTFGVSERQYEWTNGSVIKVQFLDGNKDQINLFKDAALDWLWNINIAFTYVSLLEKSDIRVSFKEGIGISSMIGTSSLLKNQNEPTIKLDWKTLGAQDYNNRKAEILHELGHALGLKHEHQSPVFPYIWNKQVVYDYYKSNNNWSEKQVDSEVLNKVSSTNHSYDNFDENSIMIYPIPPEFTYNEFSVNKNLKLSEEDKKFISERYTVPSFLRRGEQLNAGLTIISNNKKYKLIYQEDGNLVVYKESGSNPGAIWHTNTSGNSTGKLILQASDGNLVLYDFNHKVLWSSHTSNRNGGKLVLEDDGNLVLYNRNGNIDWQSQTSERNTLHRGEQLNVNGHLNSENRRYRLIYQEDGNLVLYNVAGNNRVIWTTHKSGNSTGKLILQASDGNLVQYDFNHKVLWSSHTSKKNGDKLVLENNGNLVLYNRNGNIDWQSNTSGK